MTNKNNVKQGSIFLADLNPVKGHEQSGYRPVIVLQNNILNKNLNTVIIVPITKNLNAKGYLTTFFLDKKTSQLSHDSIALLFQIRTIDKIRLKKYIYTLPSAVFYALKRQMYLVF